MLSGFIVTLSLTFPGKRPVVVLTWCKYNDNICITKRIIFYFVFSMQKRFFWLPAKLFLANFRFNGLSLPWHILYPLKQNNRNTGREMGKIKKGRNAMLQPPVMSIICIPNYSPYVFSYALYNIELLAYH